MNRSSSGNGGGPAPVTSPLTGERLDNGTNQLLLP